MPEIVENIPTLTDIIKPGDASMRNHFDAHQFDISTDTSYTILENSCEDDLQSIIEASNIIENAGSSENPDTDFEIPSIKFDHEEQTEIPEKIFSGEVDLNNQIAFNQSSDIAKTKSGNAKEKIDQAVKNILPTIEKQLKERLYKEFNI